MDLEQLEILTGYNNMIERLNIYLSLMRYVQKPTVELLDIKNKMIDLGSKIHQKYKDFKDLTLNDQLYLDLLSVFDSFRKLIAHNTQRKEGEVYFYDDWEYFYLLDSSKEKKLREQPTLSVDKLFEYCFGTGSCYLLASYINANIAKTGSKETINCTTYFSIYTHSYIHLDSILKNTLNWRMHFAKFEDLPDYEIWLSKNLMIYLVGDLTHIILRYLGSIN